MTHQHAEARIIPPIKTRNP